MVPTPSSLSDILLLGSGWTSRFLLPQALRRGLRVTCTTRSADASVRGAHLDEVVRQLEVEDGELDVRTFQLSTDVDAEGAISDHMEGGRGMEGIAVNVDDLPRAKVVVIVFPLKSPRTLNQLVEAYEGRHGATNWLQLGSSGAWGSGHSTSETPIDTSNARAVTESHLLSLHDGHSRRTSVLNLAGLYGGARQPVNFAKRVAFSKEALESKGSLHLVHGRDVARAVLAMYDALGSSDADKVWGKRWIVTDTHVYDWWAISAALHPFPSSAEWVSSLQAEQGVTSLPRPWSANNTQKAPKYLERSLDGKDFWKAVGTNPSCGRCDGEEMIMEAEQELEVSRAMSAL